MRVGRNDPCHCGSGKKYKKCCMEKDEAERAAQLDATQKEQEAQAALAAAPEENSSTDGEQTESRAPVTEEAESSTSLVRARQIAKSGAERVKNQKVRGNSPFYPKRWAGQKKGA